ncbi:Hypothetical Protein FCC1311_078372 [Hondaea fermentalgiana]|uniref:Uncharacterized protein n=1 Tax=Hondaea fermentalgiana TaxID=2315210 RepID=A0A2R5GL31_9STRA|nr:Hypothetical Protein FCC1311_078372 [Hondaea fermentalgiana]|eukprot:GBG31612.1 Hypothetical Protein FCC1311_078372 [Hondaea fermentalgiana]
MHRSASSGGLIVRCQTEEPDFWSNLVRKLDPDLFHFSPYLNMLELPGADCVCADEIARFARSAHFHVLRFDREALVGDHMLERGPQEPERSVLNAVAATNNNAYEQERQDEYHQKKMAAGESNTGIQEQPEESKYRDSVTEDSHASNSTSPTTHNESKPDVNEHHNTPADDNELQISNKKLKHPGAMQRMKVFKQKHFHKTFTEPSEQDKELWEKFLTMHKRVKFALKDRNASLKKCAHLQEVAKNFDRRDHSLTQEVKDASARIDSVVAAAGGYTSLKHFNTRAKEIKNMRKDTLFHRDAKDRDRRKSSNAGDKHDDRMHREEGQYELGMHKVNHSVETFNREAYQIITSKELSDLFDAEFELLRSLRDELNQHDVNSSDVKAFTKHWKDFSKRMKTIMKA